MRIKFKDFTGAIESFFRNDATVARTYQFPNRDITVAGTDDVATVQSDINTHEALTNNPHIVTKTQVGLSNVDNTTDAGKPVSTAQQTALDLKQNTLVSGTSIKTINTTSLLGSGDITIAGGTIDATPTNGSTNAVQSDGVFDALALKAPLASPTLTGTPAAPTAAFGTNTTQLATTAFVQAATTQAAYRVFNIVDYGAVQDSTTDNTAAIQAAIDDCIANRGTLYIPCTVSSTNFNYYRINSPLEIIGDATNDQIWMNIEAEGHINYQIVYHGANNGSALIITGLKGGYINNLKLRIANGITGTTCFDLGTNATSTTGGFTFKDCAASLGNGINNKGWRIGGVSEGSNGDISNITWINCNCWGGQQYGFTGQIGFNLVGTNSLQFNWYGGGGSFLDNFCRIDGGGSIYFFGAGGSNNTVDYYINYTTPLIINGGRWELGKAFLIVAGADNPSFVTISNVQLGSYTPSTAEYFMQIGQGCTLIIDSLTVYKEGGVGYTGPIINLYADFASIGNVHWRGGAIMASGASLCNVVNAAKWHLDIKNVGRYTTGFNTTTYFTNVDN